MYRYLHTQAAYQGGGLLVIEPTDQPWGLSREPGALHVGQQALLEAGDVWLQHAGIAPEGAERLAEVEALCDESPRASGASPPTLGTSEPCYVHPQ